MKMVMIVFNAAIDEEIAEGLQDIGIDAYTKWPKVLGKGATSDPHLDSHIWPGVNSSIFLAVEDDRVPAVLDKVRELEASVGKEGLKAFVWSLEEEV